MKIGIDIDDTMADFSSPAIKDAAEFDKNLRNTGTIDVNKWIGRGRFDWSLDEFDQFEKQTYRNNILHLKPFDQVKEVIDQLRKEGDEIIIISARTTSHYKKPLQSTKKWLKKNNIVVDKVFVKLTSKEETIKNENIDIYIDDIPRNCLLASNLGVKTFLFHTNWNKDYVLEGISRVYNWEEVYKNIKEYKESKSNE